MTDSRQRTALVLLRNHFNSSRQYPLEEKIAVANMIVEDGMKDSGTTVTPEWSTLSLLSGIFNQHKITAERRIEVANKVIDFGIEAKEPFDYWKQLNMLGDLFK